MKHLPDDALSSLAALGVVPRDGAMERLREFARLLEQGIGGRFGNLLGPHEMGRLWTRHILESAAYVPHVIGSDPVVDIGSGAGFPGMVMAVFGINVTMVERRRKRYLFLLWARDSMGLGNAGVIHGGIEDAGPFPKGTMFTARAVEKPERLLHRIAGIAPDGYTLTVRVANPYSIPCEKVVFELPSPPLDRPGFMVQFRHPGSGPPAGNRKQ